MNSKKILKWVGIFFLSCLLFFTGAGFLIASWKAFLIFIIFTGTAIWAIWKKLHLKEKHKWLFTIGISVLVFIVVVITFPPTQIHLDKVLPTNQSQAKISGKAEAESHLWLMKDNQIITQIQTGTNGVFELEVKELAEGENRFTVKVCKEEEQKHCNQETISILVDKTPPASPIINNFPSTSTKNEVEIEGIAEEKAEVKVFVNDEEQTITETKKDGSFKAKIRLNEGENKIMAVVVDGAGNVSELSNAIIIKKEMPTGEEEREVKKEPTPSISEPEPEPKPTLPQLAPKTWQTIRSWQGSGDGELETVDIGNRKLALKISWENAPEAIYDYSGDIRPSQHYGIHQCEREGSIETCSLIIQLFIDEGYGDSNSGTIYYLDYDHIPPEILTKDKPMLLKVYSHTETTWTVKLQEFK